MLAKLPRQLPSVRLLLDRQATPALTVATAMRVSTSTVARWARDDAAPHAVHVALFLASDFGVDLVACEARNTACLQAAIARSNQDQVQLQAARIGYLLSIGDFGSANLPILGVSGSAGPGSMSAPRSHLGNPASLQKAPACRVAKPSSPFG